MESRAVGFAPRARGYIEDRGQALPQLRWPRPRHVNQEEWTGQCPNEHRLLAGWACLGLSVRYMQSANRDHSGVRLKRKRQPGRRGWQSFERVSFAVFSDIDLADIDLAIKQPEDGSGCSTKREPQAGPAFGAL